MIAADAKLINMASVLYWDDAFMDALDSLGNLVVGEETDLPAKIQVEFQKLHTGVLDLLSYAKGLDS
jgi:hypothetical protein